MKTIFRSAALCALTLLYGALPQTLAYAEPAASHCANDEMIVFSCPVDNKQLLSVCASQKYGPDTGYLQYRYGPAGKQEVLLPAEKLAPAKAAQSGMWTFSGGGGAYVRFMDGETAQYVYSAIGRWGENGETIERAGAAVEKDGKLIKDIRCAGPEASELGPDFFAKAGLAEVESEFELPE